MSPHLGKGVPRQVLGLLVAVALLVAPLLSRTDMALASGEGGPAFVLCTSAPDNTHDTPLDVHGFCRFACSMACHGPVLPSAIVFGMLARLPRPVLREAEGSTTAPFLPLLVLRIRGPPLASIS